MNRLHHSLLIVLMFLVLPSNEAAAQGIPEPELIFYGTVTDRRTGEVITDARIEWSITRNSETQVALIATSVSVGEQKYYVLAVPMETRVAGTAPTSNTLELSPTPLDFGRHAKVDGRTADMVSESANPPMQFTVSAVNRGLIERIDLVVDWSGDEPKQTWSEWLARWGLAPNTDPEADPARKGMTYQEQFIAGTDPTDPDSVFQILEIRIDATDHTTVSIVWTSSPGRTYTVERSSGLSGTFSTIEHNIAIPQSASTDRYTYEDTTATGAGPYFYRVTVHY